MVKVSAIKHLIALMDSGADNCSIISKNIEMVSNFGTPNPFVAKRRPAPYKP
jgi:hypothetical protein